MGWGVLEKAMSTKKASVVSAKQSQSPVVSEGEMFGEFQDWCLRTYGDSGKTKTVTRRKYNKIIQTLLQGDDSDGVYLESNHINAKFKFWVKSKGFQVGSAEDENDGSDRPVLYVPIKTTVSRSVFSFNTIAYTQGDAQPRLFGYTQI